MTADRRLVNSAASVRARLYNLAKQRGAEFQLVLSEFAIERLLYRLASSSYRDQFVLKGAMLFKLWDAASHRATWDLDLLGRGMNTVAAVVAVIKDLCDMAAPDGIVFDPLSVKGEEIKAGDEYAGVRVLLLARLAEARIPVQVDVGFGDAVVPAPTWQAYPTLLDHQPPRILVYPREVVVAEKLEAMLILGVTNSRMKDFYDIQVLASKYSFQGPRLAKAVRATLARRGTPIPKALPLVFTAEFLSAPDRQVQWRAFLRRGRLEAPPDGAGLAERLQAFLGPVLDALVKGESFDRSWQAGGPWK
jgi:hypothetical protein